jgi:hypothetical protein
MNDSEDDIEFKYPFEKIQSDIDECNRRIDVISSYQVNRCMKMILDLDYIVCSDRYRSEEMIQANSMIIDSISIRQDMFAELINYLIKHLDLDSEERVLNIEKNYLKENKNKFDIATLQLEKIDATFKEELNKRKDFIDEFLKTSLNK